MKCESSSAASPWSPGRTWAYVSSVNATEWCPSRSETIFGFTPAWSSSEACVWRRFLSGIGRNFASLTWLRNIVLVIQHDDPRLQQALDTPAGRMFEQACSQCHALPDPGSHTAAEWPAVVRRMQRNMLWMNRVVGSRFDPREPQLRPVEIIEFLQRHARR